MQADAGFRNHNKHLNNPCLFEGAQERRISQPVITSIATKEYQEYQATIVPLGRRRDQNIHLVVTSTIHVAAALTEVLGDCQGRM